MAALNYLDGKIASFIAPEHTNVEWLTFLKKLDREMPDDVTLHLIVDNYGTHKHPNVRSWLKWRNARNRTSHGLDRMVIHFTPTSSSWMNLIERFFRDLTEDANGGHQWLPCRTKPHPEEIHLESRGSRDPQKDRKGTCRRAFPICIAIYETLH